MLWKSRNSQEKLNYLKLILSNQFLRVNGVGFEKVTIEYNLKEPFKKLAEIKKATIESGFLKSWYTHGDSNPGYRREKAMS